MRSAAVPVTDKRPLIRMPTAAEDAAIRAAAKADPDAQALTPAQLSKLVPVRLLHRIARVVLP